MYTSQTVGTGISGMFQLYVGQDLQNRWVKTVSEQRVIGPVTGTTLLC